jgi:EpsI family protein
LTAEQPSNAASSPGATAAAARPRPARRPDARLSLGLAASLLLAGVACRELLRFEPPGPAPVSPTGHVEEWFFEPSDSSPLVILLLFGWLLWRRRARLAALWGQRGPWIWTAIPWLVAVAAFTWAVRTGAPELQAIALIPALLGAANLLGGLAALRVVAAPAPVLLFAVPIPAPLLNQVLWRLQIGTADFTGLLLQMLRMPVIVSGDRLIMRDGLFAIIETCSGLRSIETLALLAILMIDLFGRRGWHALLLLVLSPFVAFLINGLRCLGLIFNPHADVASIHSLQGIVMLLGGVLLLYFIDGWIARFHAEPAPISALERRARRGAGRSGLAPRVALLVGFSALWVAISWLPRFPPPLISAEVPAYVVERTLDGWEGADAETDWIFLGKVGFGQIMHRRYARGAEVVDAFVGQAALNGRVRSYLSPKVGYPGSGWMNEREEVARVAGRDATLRVVRKGATRSLVATWFEDSPGLAVETSRALLSLDSGPLLVRSRIPLAIRLATPVATAEDRAIELSRARLERFAERLSPSLQILSTPRESSALGERLFTNERK